MVNLSLGGTIVCRGSFLFGGRKILVMPRYFFTLVYPDRIMSDPRGMVLPTDEAAIGVARPIIDDLLEDSRPGEPRPIIMVRNQAGEVVYQFPGN
jgi:hypothetical protein